MEQNKLINELKERINLQKPGNNSHRKMAPTHKGNYYRSFNAPADARQSGVLIPLTYEQDMLSIIFTLRSAALKHHSRQISFPGGAREDNEALEQTALRETWEEIGIDEDKIEILGELSPLYVPPSRSVVHPFVAFLPSLPPFRINYDEVEEVMIMPVELFLGKQNFRKEIWDISGMEVDVPYWDIDHEVPLWGATAMILREFLDIYEDVSY